VGGGRDCNEAATCSESVADRRSLSGIRWSSLHPLSKAALRPPRDIRGVACGIAAPISAAEFWSKADAVVRVRIESYVPYHDYGGTYRPDILSAVEATVLDVFQRHARGVSPGATMTITHPGGTMMRVDGLETQTVNAFSPQRLEPNGSCSCAGGRIDRSSGSLTWTRARFK